MDSQVLFDTELIKRYDKPGPRYTSYPPATQYSEQVCSTDYRNWSRDSNEEPIPRPLSLYFHIPSQANKADYCSCQDDSTGNRQMGLSYLEDLYLEIELHSHLFDRDRIVQQLHWGGGTPNFLENDEIRALMQQTGRYFQLLKDDSGEYSIEITPNTASIQSINLFRDIGFNRLSLNVQDLDTKVQKVFNRNQTYELTQSIIGAARSADFKSINIDLVYGLPGQSVKSFEKTLDRLIDLNPDRIALYNDALLPIRFSAIQPARTEKAPTADIKLAIFEYSVERLIRAGYLYIGMDHFAKPHDELLVAQRKGKLHRNFQGYSIYPESDSIAMGVSAISNIGNHYCQNTTDLKAYHNSLSQGQLPIYRGCFTEPEDVIRRDIIQQLSCNFHLDIKTTEARWNIDFKSFFPEEFETLVNMSKDRLLLISDSSIEVLDSGRLLVRNICMVFDRYIDSADSRRLFQGRFKEL